MSERRVLIAALLSSVFLVFYAQTIARKTRALPTPRALQQEALVAHPAEEIIPQPLEHEEIITIESPQLRVEIGASSADVRRITLKEFKDESRTQSLTIAGDTPLWHLQDPAESLSWKVVRTAPGTVEFESEVRHGKNHHVLYSIDADNPLLVITLDAESLSQNDGIMATAMWKKTDSLGDRYNRLESIALYKGSNGKKSYKRFFLGKKQAFDVPRGTVQLTMAERYFCQVIRPRSGQLEITMLPHAGTEPVISARVRPIFSDGQTADTARVLTIYAGPRDYFHLKRAGFEDAIPIGTIGQIGLILLTLLSWVAGLTKNYGIAIIVFSLLISCATAPFTLTGIRSMKRMQELKPRVDQILAKHKDDPKRANQEVFALYKTQRVSPLGGCLPMVMQIPIFLAMFNAISHFIELRGQSFLWVRDLSLPDRIAHLPITLPILGNELNLLPIVMAAAMYAQSKTSQRNVSSDPNNPAAAMMSGPLMSVIFGVMFYQFPAGLVLYWLTNSVSSIVWYRLAK